MNNVESFKNTFIRLSKEHKVSRLAADIHIYVISVTSKLQSSRMHLESVLSTKELVLLTQQSYSGSTSGYTFSPISSISSPTQQEITRNVDGFFGNLASAFDIVGQVINLVFLVPPLEEQRVTFDWIITELVNRCGGKKITQYLTTLKKQQWYKDLKKFRRCTIHTKIIQCKTVTEHSVMQTTWPKVTEILIPDEPFRNKPTYSKNLTIQGFGKAIFLNALNAIDEIYGIMDAEVITADKIPV